MGTKDKKASSVSLKKATLEKKPDKKAAKTVEKILKDEVIPINTQAEKEKKVEKEKKKDLEEKKDSEIKDVKIPEKIVTIADDIIDEVSYFDKILLKQLMKNIKFRVSQRGVPVCCASCVTLKKEASKKKDANNNSDVKKEEENNTEFIGFEKIKKIKVKVKEDTKESKKQESTSDKSTSDNKDSSDKKLSNKKPLYEEKEVVTSIIVHTKDCKHILHTKDRSKLGREIKVEKSPYFNISDYDVEKWVHFLSENDALIVHFPVNILKDIEIKKSPAILNNRELKERDLSSDVKRKIQEYAVTRDGVLSKVIVWDIPTENVGIYELINSKIGVGTETVLKGIGKELTNKIKISSEDVTDPKKMMELRDTFKKISEELLHDTLPSISDETFNFLVGTLVHRFYGLGILEIMLADDNLEEIVINSSTEAISVFHRKYGWLKSTKYFATELDIYNISAQIGRKVGQQINSLNPIMDAHLLTGDRVASTIFPISTAGNTITIRRFTRSPWSIVNFITEEMHLFSKEIAALVWLCMQYELNVIVAGGTASGKTSVLNILSSMITPQNRILSIEDTREIQLPKALQWNWIPLSCKRSNAEGQGEVTMLDLIVAALRMRPDRIIVGEIRRPEQAQALFEAMHTGHSVYATIHADTASQVIDRLKEEPMNVPETELEALHLIVMQYRDRRTGRRRTREVVEIVPAKDGISLNHLYRWQPRTDKFEKVNDSIRIFEELSLHTGMTPSEIQEDLDKKAHILQWLLDGKVFDHDIIGEIYRFYYKDPEWLYKESKSKTVLEMLNEVKSKEFTFSGMKEESLHFKKDFKEEIISKFYKMFEVYNEQNWLKFLKTLDLSDPKVNEVLYTVKSELTK